MMPGRVRIDHRSGEKWAGASPGGPGASGSVPGIVSTSETPPGAPTDPSTLVDTLVADRFRPNRLVSTGANTVIYVATDEQTGRTVTLKLIQPRLAASPSFREAFDDTMRGVAALSHPNIAAVYDWGIAPVGDTSTAYVVIEHLTGGSLRDLVDRGRRLSPSQALAVGLDACRGLDHAHRRGFVHTELTPSKLVFGDDRRLRIVDLGLARLLGAPTWEHPESVDNHVAWYSAPEQGLQRPVDDKADVYALCLTLQEAVTGALPFKADSTVASLAARVGKLMPVSADLGPLASVFERAGRPEADERASAAEFGKGLVQAASKLPRPEPLPLLSSGLFDTPTDELRSPDDPTGGVVRPGASTDEVLVVPLDEPDHPAGGEPAADGEPSGEIAPSPPRIVEAEPGAEIPTVDPEDDLVILPLDAELRAGAFDPNDVSEPTEPAPMAAVASAPTDGVASTPVTQAMPVTAGPAPRRRRGASWKVLLGLVVVAAIAVLGILATQLFATPVATVPDLTDLPRAEALNLIAPNGWEVEETIERSDVVPTVDHVVRTTPRAGSALAEGEPFLIVVSGGPMLRELPESTGANLADAQTTLIDRGLAVDVVEQYDETVPAGVIVSWSVPADATLATGAMVEPETVVQLVVSRGPEPRVVPDLVGVEIEVVRERLAELVLVIEELPEEFSDDVPSGEVIRQEPAAGTEVERGAAVQVVVSKGVDLVEFPDLGEATSYEEAAQLLLEAGFEPRLRFGDAQGAVRDVTIDGEEPAVGEAYRRGTVVDISAL